MDYYSLLFGSECHTDGKGFFSAKYLLFYIHNKQKSLYESETNDIFVCVRFESCRLQILLSRIFHAQINFIRSSQKNILGWYSIAPVHYANKPINFIPFVSALKFAYLHVLIKMLIS